MEDLVLGFPYDEGKDRVLLTYRVPPVALLCFVVFISRGERQQQQYCRRIPLSRIVPKSWRAHEARFSGSDLRCIADGNLSTAWKPSLPPWERLYFTEVASTGAAPLGLGGA